MSNAKNMTDQKSKSIIDYPKNHSSDNTPTLRFPEFKGEWEKKKLGEVAEKINSGKTPLGGESVYSDKGILFIRSQNVNDDKLSFENSTYISEKINNTMKNSVVLANDILLNITGASLGRSCVVPNDFTIGNVNQHVCIIRIDKKNNPNFIQPILSSEKGQNIFTSLQTGSGREGLNFQSIKGIEISFPTLAEQTKIAEFFTAIDKKISHLKTKKQLLQQYKKGVMQQLFSSEAGYSGLEDEQDFDETHPTILKCQNQDIKDLKMNRINNKTNPTILKSRKSRFRQDDGSEFPKWEMKKLGEIGEITTGKLDANAMVENGEYRFYTCARDFYRIDKFAFDTEALLISGNGANVGYIHYYKGKFNAYQRTYVLDGFKENIIFIKYFLDKNLYERINLEKKEGNTPYIVLSTLSEMEISIPSLPEQTKIANFLSSIDEKINRTETQIEQTQTWKKGLLQKMFI